MYGVEEAMSQPDSASAIQLPHITYSTLVLIRICLQIAMRGALSGFLSQIEGHLMSPRT